MIRRRSLLLPLVSLLVASAAPAAPPGFAFLEVPAGARASAMGGAYLAVAEGVEGAFWNPATLSGVQGTQLVATHYEFFESLRHDQFALAGQLFGGGMAASVRAMYTEPIEERDELGNLIGTFGAHDLEMQLGYGRKGAGGTSVGFAAQLVRERIASESAMTWGMSAGLAWLPERWRDLRAGLAVQHLGPAAHYEFDGQRGAPVGLPLALHGGLAWHRALGRGLALTPALDVRATRGRQAVVALGGELESETGASLRAGLRQGDDIANFSAGLGWRYRGYRVDYAWVPSKLDLGDTHRFSFGAQF
ncbi:MAG: PorV/PorQ family protein [Candidatus Eisenbacteria bacterium]|nr:PorV/PorQ family protein [Candidatus Eisenbacteria bacterium]